MNALQSLVDYLNGSLFNSVELIKNTNLFVSIVRDEDQPLTAVFIQEISGGEPIEYGIPYFTHRYSMLIRSESRESARMLALSLCGDLAAAPRIGSGAHVSVSSTPDYIGQDGRGHLYRFECTLQGGI